MAIYSIWYFQCRQFFLHLGMMSYSSAQCSPFLVFLLMSNVFLVLKMLPFAKLVSFSLFSQLTDSEQFQKLDP
jgi:hypothetical protein